MTDHTLSLDFARRRKRKPISLNLTPLIDVLFILIVFFMLTTSFMRMESLELILPSAASASSASDDTLHIFIAADGEITLGRRLVEQGELVRTVKHVFKKDPNTRIMLLTAEGVSLQKLVEIMDQVTLAGGKSLMVRKWEQE